MPSDLRHRKRLAMRGLISDAATRLFAERGFDSVTVDEIAEAADVGRKTVFNYFRRKEDLFFDRDEDIRARLADAFRARGDVGPIECLRLLAHRLARERSPYIESSATAVAFMEAIAASEALKNRARSLRDELTEFVAHEFAACAGRESEDADAFLAASLMLATWVSARVLAHRAFIEHRNAGKARATFLDAIDKGCGGMQTAMQGTTYAGAARDGA